MDPVAASVRVIHVPGLRVRVDVNGLAVDLIQTGGRVLLSGLHPRIELDGRELLAPGDPGERALSVAVGEVKSRAGPARRVEIQSLGGGSPGLRWTLEIDSEGRGLAASLAVENRSDRPMWVGALVPLALTGGAKAVQPQDSWRLELPMASLLGEALRLLRPGDSSQSALLCAFTSARRSDPAVEAELSGGRVDELAWICRRETAELEPGQLWESDRAWLAVGQDRDALLRHWCARAGADGAARAPARPRVLLRGAGSHPPGSETPSQVTELADLLGASAAESVLEIDGRPARSDLEIARMAADIRNAGFQAGADLPSASGLEELVARIRSLREAGVTCFSLDPDGLPGANRDRLADLRAAAGDRALLVATRAPTRTIGALAAVGEVDALCPWPPPSSRRARRASGGGARLGELLETAATGQRLWLLDTGDLLENLHEREPADARARISVAGLAGGLVRLDAGLTRGERGTWLARALPPLGRAIFPATQVRRDGGPTLVAPLLGERRAVVLLNESESDAALGLDLGTLGLDAPQHVFDFWEERYLGVVEQFVPSASVAPGGCRVLGLSPILSRPQVVGSSLHLGMGTLEVASLRELAGGGLHVSLRLPGWRSGSIWVAPAHSRVAKSAAVRFRARGAVEIPD
jgi:hypothetical protein